LKRAFVAITKVVAEERMVWGYASTTALDFDGDRITLGAMRDALPDYMRFANIREMHQPSAVGTAVSATVDDVGLYLGAKVVDDAAWRKVETGVYKGFSLGCLVKASDKAKKCITKMKLYEISLVDRPANPDSVFDIWKLAKGDDMTLDLSKYGGPEAATEADVVALLEKLLDKHATEAKTYIDKNASVTKELVELRVANSGTIALQNEVEVLKAQIADRDSKEKDVRMKKLLDDSARAGKFKEANRDKWEKVFKSAGENVCAQLLKDAPVVVPIGERKGTGGEDEESIDARCNKAVDAIMARDHITRDKAIEKGFREHRALFAERNKVQRARANAHRYSTGDDDDSDSDGD